MSDQNQEPLSLTQREPVAVWVAIQGIVMAMVNLIVLFGVDLTAEQIAGINAVLVAIGALVGILWVRSNTTPVAKLQQQ